VDVWSMPTSPYIQSLRQIETGIIEQLAIYLMAGNKVIIATHKEYSGAKKYVHDRLIAYSNAPGGPGAKLLQRISEGGLTIIASEDGRPKAPGDSSHDAIIATFHYQAGREKTSATLPEEEKIHTIPLSAAPFNKGQIVFKHGLSNEAKQKLSSVAVIANDYLKDADLSLHEVLGQSEAAFANVGSPANIPGIADHAEGVASTLALLTAINDAQKEHFSTAPAARMAVNKSAGNIRLPNGLLNTSYLEEIWRSVATEKSVRIGWVGGNVYKSMGSGKDADIVYLDDENGPTPEVIWHALIARFTSEGLTVEISPRPTGRPFGRTAQPYVRTAVIRDAAGGSVHFDMFLGSMKLDNFKYILMQLKKAIEVLGERQPSKDDIQVLFKLYLQIEYYFGDDEKGSDQRWRQERDAYLQVQTDNEGLASNWLNNGLTKRSKELLAKPVPNYLVTVHNENLPMRLPVPDGLMGWLAAYEAKILGGAADVPLAVKEAGARLAEENGRGPHGLLYGSESLLGALVIEVVGVGEELFVVMTAPGGLNQELRVRSLRELAGMWVEAGDDIGHSGSTEPIATSEDSLGEVPGMGSMDIQTYQTIVRQCMRMRDKNVPVLLMLKGTVARSIVAMEKDKKSFEAFKNLLQLLLPDNTFVHVDGLKRSQDTGHLAPPTARRATLAGLDEGFMLTPGQGAALNQGPVLHPLVLMLMPLILQADGRFDLNLLMGGRAWTRLMNHRDPAVVDAMKEYQEALALLLSAHPFQGLSSQIDFASSLALTLAAVASAA
jgi:hypothetical protein